MIVHLGMPRAGSSFLQKQIFPSVNEADNQRFVGKRYVSAGYGFESPFDRLDQLCRLTDFSSVDLDRFEVGFRAGLGAGFPDVPPDRVLYSSEVLSGWQGRSFAEKLAVLDRMLDAPRYFLVLRDPVRLLLGAHLVILLANVSYISERNGNKPINLETSKSRLVLSHFTDRALELYEKDRPQSFLHKVLDYRSILTELSSRQAFICGFEFLVGQTEHFVAEFARLSGLTCRAETGQHDRENASDTVIDQLAKLFDKPDEATAFFQQQLASSDREVERVLQIPCVAESVEICARLGGDGFLAARDVV